MLVMSSTTSARPSGASLAPFAAFLLLAACSVPRDRPPADSAGSTEHPVPREAAQDERSRCGVLENPGEEYGARVKPNRGRPGDPLTLFGTTFRGEDWRWAPSRKIEFWWDYRLQDGPRGMGNGFLLARVLPRDACTFRTTSTIPDVPPGGYWLRALVFHRGGFGFLGEERVRVLPVLGLS